MAREKKKKERKLNDGFTCDCGKRNTFHPYVYAHWNEDLIATCTACDRKYRLLRGKVRKI